MGYDMMVSVQITRHLPTTTDIHFPLLFLLPCLLPLCHPLIEVAKTPSSFISNCPNFSSPPSFPPSPPPFSLYFILFSHSFSSASYFSLGVISCSLSHSFFFSNCPLQVPITHLFLVLPPSTNWIPLPSPSSL